MRASLARVLCVGTVLMLSPAVAEPAAGPAPPDSEAHTRLTTSLLELLLTLRLGPSEVSIASQPAAPQPHLRRHAAAAPLVLAAAPVPLPVLTPP
jgi:hypothetical protein